MERDAIDLVILDVMLQREDSFSLCGKLRATSRVPIIMLTCWQGARSSSERRRHSLVLAVHVERVKNAYYEQLGARSVNPSLHRYHPFAGSSRMAPLT